MILTVDASVFVSYFRPSEPSHAESVIFFAALAAVPTDIYCPSLVLPEVAASIARTIGDPSLVSAAAAYVESMPSMTLIDLTTERARKVADLAGVHKLRGADAVYAQVAQEFGATLITWDREMLSRLPPAVPVITPTDYLASFSGAS